MLLNSPEQPENIQNINEMHPVNRTDDGKRIRSTGNDGLAAEVQYGHGLAQCRPSGSGWDDANFVQFLVNCKFDALALPGER